MKVGNRQIFLGKLVEPTVIHGHPVSHGHKKLEAKEIFYSNWDLIRIFLLLAPIWPGQLNRLSRQGVKGNVLSQQQIPS